MVLSDERATPGEGIGPRRIYDFWTMLEVAEIYALTALKLLAKAT